MLELDLFKRRRPVFKVLCLGSHCDDIEIGSGGSILKLQEQHKNTMFYWVVFSSDKQREHEAIVAANSFLKGAETKNVIVKTFRESFFPFNGMEIKEFFEQLKQDFSPDLIFTHYRSDLHQDHRLISELTWNTFRNHLILEYEIPKYDGDLGTPNVFINLEERICREKIQYILKSFKSQRDKPWFTKDTFWSILRIRGIEANSTCKYAEAFYARKITCR